MSQKAQGKSSEKLNADLEKPEHPISGIKISDSLRNHNETVFKT